MGWLKLPVSGYNRELSPAIFIKKAVAGLSRRELSQDERRI
jgi:hypothetical protein